MKERHKALFRQMNIYREDLLAVVEDVTEEEADIIPHGFNNNIRWNLGHTYLDLYLWIEDVTKEGGNYPKVFNDWFGFGTTPEDFTEDTPSFLELKELLKDQIKQIKDVYGHRLDEEFPPTSMENYTTIEQVLVRTVFHEGMHLQAITDIKKLIK
ncbi:DinB family protein [Evansella sp. AB-P1]|uniref:DinB family protein n=1 Tax=Evansella sp. AB-P1 TaxID=3037653 RepID=UPI00241C2285|nr:DinB family protein [Evansella sp. AB-P1]MDG5789749.1 DinB family protein [Evansella sp. AB-P1]